MQTNYKVTENTEAGMFEIHTDGYKAFLKYKIKDGKIYLTHTEVPVELERRGIGSELVRQALEIIEKRDLKVVPACSFVVSYFDRHPEWEPLL